MLCCSFTSFATSKGFPDVPTSHWAYASISNAANNGIATGYSDGTFRPSHHATYAHFSAFLTRAIYASEIVVADDSAAEWFSPYTKVLLEHSIPFEYQSNINAPLHVYDCAQIMYRVLVDHQFLLSIPFSASLDRLPNKDSIPPEYQTAMSITYALGLLDGIWGSSPLDEKSISRAQACVAIDTLSKLLLQDNEHPALGQLIGGDMSIFNMVENKVTIILTNAGTKSFSYSSIPSLSRYLDGQWSSIPFCTPDGTVTDVSLLRLLHPNQIKTHTINLSNYYGDLSPGHYKLEISLSQNDQTYYLFEYFSI